MKRNVLLMMFITLLVTNQIWAEGLAESSSSKIHPGARMVLEANGYKFDSNSNLTGYRNFKITDFPYEDETNTNPHAYEKNIIYVTTFDANQWLDKSILATTGNANARATTTAITNRMFGTFSPAITGNRYGTRIFIKDIPDAYLKEIETSASNAFLIYVGAETFQMADGSSQVFPVFQLFDLFDNTISQALRSFNNSFDSGVYKEEDGYQYSKIYDRTFGRDKATKKELYEWDGSQWITIIGESKK